MWRWVASSSDTDRFVAGKCQFNHYNLKGSCVCTPIAAIVTLIHEEGQRCGQVPIGALVGDGISWRASIDCSLVHKPNVDVWTLLCPNGYLTAECDWHVIIGVATNRCAVRIWKGEGGVVVYLHNQYYSHGVCAFVALEITIKITRCRTLIFSCTVTVKWKSRQRRTE